MHPWLKVAISYVSIMLLRSLLSYIKYRRLTRYHDEYREYVGEGGFDFPEKKSQVIGLFKDAGISDFVVHGVEPAGFGQIMKYQTSGFANLTTRHENVVPTVDMKFMEAIGAFKDRTIQSVNPIFWIDFLLKLPQYLFGYLNVKPKNVAVKFVQVIYWCITILAALDAMGIIDVSTIIEK